MSFGQGGPHPVAGLLKSGHASTLIPMMKRRKHARQEEAYHGYPRVHSPYEGDLPELGDLQRLLDETMKAPPPPQNVSSVEPYRSTVKKLHDQGVEMAAIHERLKERGYRGSYASVVRFVKRLDPVEPETTSRVETPPGEEMQIDFGYAGRMLDEAGEYRKTWAFVATLSWSRHQYDEGFPGRYESTLGLSALFSCSSSVHPNNKLSERAFG
jgi:hypothetical protein